MLELLLSPARAVFCEEPLKGPIRHPADTWSNIGPVIAGVLVMFRAQTGLVWLLGAAAVWMGAASAIFHATGTLGGEMLDLHGMYFFILVFGVCQHKAHGYFVDWYDAVLNPIGWATILSVGFLWLPWLGIPVFAVLLGAVVVRQWNRGFDARWYWLLGTFAVAFAFWLLDYFRVLCCPCNHVLSGHGVWHLLMGPIVWQSAKIFEAATYQRRGYVLR